MLRPDHWMCFALFAACCGAPGQEPGGRFAPQARYEQDTARTARDQWENLAGESARFATYLEGDIQAGRQAAEALARAHEQVAEALLRDDEKGAAALRDKVRAAEKARDLWYQRIWEFRRRQYELAYTERSFRDDQRWVKPAVQGAFDRFVEARRAGSEAWGAAARATAPGMDEARQAMLKEEAYAADAEVDIAEALLQWARAREEMTQDRRIVTPQLLEKLEQVEALQQEKARLRRLDAGRERERRELERKLSAEMEQTRILHDKARAQADRQEEEKRRRPR